MDAPFEDTFQMREEVVESLAELNPRSAEEISISTEEDVLEVEKNDEEFRSSPKSLSFLEEDHPNEDAYKSSETELKLESYTSDNLENKEINIHKSFDEFKLALTDHECQHYFKYSILKTSKNFTEKGKLEDLTGSKAPRMLWEFSGKDDHLPMKYTGTPYMVLGVQDYQCQHGKDFHTKGKEKLKKRKEEMISFEHACIRTRKLVQPTKKLDCPATFLAKKIFLFSKYKLEKDTKRKRTEMSKVIKEHIAKLMDSKSKKTDALELLGEVQYLSIFPPLLSHKNHHTGEAAGISEPLDDRVAEYIKQQIRNGCRRTKELQARTRDFVREKLFPGEIGPTSHRRRFRPSRKKIKNLVTAVKVETRFSKIDQVNLDKIKDEWSEWADVHYEAAIKKDIDESDSESDVSSDDEEETVRARKKSNKAKTVEDKLIFVYQSPAMKRLYQRYGHSLLLLDATYKTTKYALPLFFAVVKTNVNYQVAAVLVFQEETKAMIKKGLNILKSWSPTVLPKYCMVDFDQNEISALEEVFPGTTVFLCDFHREQAWTRWTSKADHGVSPYADEVKARLRRIAHAYEEDELQKALSDLLRWERYKGKLAQWFGNTWRPELKRWATFYRPKDLMLTNTNNGTERLNRELKTEQLEDYKHCSLSEMLSVVVNSFLPELYDRYIELNVCYSSKHKKYATGLPKHFENRPKPIVDRLLSRQGAVDAAMVESVRTVNENVFTVKSADQCSIERKLYFVDFGDDKNFCSCTCADFSKNRMLCKHFFSAFKSGVRTFDDLTPLFTNHVWMVLDDDLFDNTLNAVENENIVQSNVSLETELIESVEVEEEVAPTPPPEIEMEQPFHEHDELPVRRNSLKQEQTNLRAKLKEFNDLSYLIKDTSLLRTLNFEINALLNSAKSVLKNDSNLIERCSPRKRKLKNKRSQAKRVKQVLKVNKKHPFSHRVGQHAEMMRQLYRAKIFIKDGDNDTTKIKKQSGNIEVEGVPEIEFPGAAPNLGTNMMQEENVETEGATAAECSVTKVVGGNRSRKDKCRMSAVLTTSIKEDVSNGRRLRGDCVNLCLKLLKIQFPLVNGFEDTDAGEKGFFSHLEENFVQILYHAEHWTAVFLLRDKQICYCNSLYQRDIAKEIWNQICDLAHVKESFIKLLIMPVQQQTNAIDCGLFAVAFITDALFDVKPVGQQYDVSLMRFHLLACLEKGSLTPFPRTNKRCKTSKSFMSYQDIFCVCRRGYFTGDDEKDTGLFMAECCECNEWFHKRCYGIPTKVFRDDDSAATWNCKDCT